MRRLVLLLFFILYSCGLTKTTNKKTEDRVATEQIKSSITRIGDTVTFQVPRVRYRDTTLYSVNHVGTRIETRYNEHGEIELINCYASTINELREERRELVELIKEKQKEETAETDKLLVYGILALLAGGLGYLFFRFDRLIRRLN